MKRYRKIFIQQDIPKGMNDDDLWIRKKDIFFQLYVHYAGHNYLCLHDDKNLDDVILYLKSEGLLK